MHTQAKKRSMEVEPLSEKKNLIVDPSFFAHPRAVSMLLRSKLADEHSVVIPTLIYEIISKRDYETFVSTLSRWEDVTPSQLERTWSEITDVSSRILDNMLPCARVLDGLSSEQRSILAKIDEVLRIPQRIRKYDRLCLRMSREIIETACVTSLVVSVSDRAKRWYRRFSGTIVKRVEENDTLIKAKEETRNRMKEAGWKGTVLIWLCKHIPIPFAGDVIDIILVLSTDGAYRCQNCGKSLWRLPRDIVFCPYCSNPL